MLEPPHNTICQIYEQCLQPKDCDPLIYFQGIWCKMQKQLITENISTAQQKRTSDWFNVYVQNHPKLHITPSLE
jgi:hypothetical protein